MVFVTLANFRGDVHQTSEALHLPLDELRGMVDRYRWTDRLRAMGIVAGNSPSSKQDATTRFLNRAVNFVQAARLRELVDRVTRDVLSSEEKLEEYTTVVTKSGTRRDLRAVTDLVNAANVAQQMTARALQDHADNEAADKAALEGQELSLSLGQAMDAAMAGGKPITDVIRDLNEASESSLLPDPTGGKPNT